MFNKVILVGNLTRDIELRYLNSGSALASTAIATNRRYTLNGEKREEVCFIDITFWGKTAEIANQYLKKGSRILIEGRLKFEQWQDSASGQNRSKHTITVEAMQMLGDSAQNKEYGNTQNRANYSQSNYGQNNYNQNSYNQSNYGQNSYQQNRANNQQNHNNYDEFNDSYDVPDINVDEDMDEELPKKKKKKKKKN